jgi:2-amino-4-hydroxy-6-hydroxymethyldihydropteridine diphosphokinase
MLVQAGIALGSNLGDRYSELNAGIAFLRTLSVINEVREPSRINTAPVDCPPGSAEFLNSVAEIDIDSDKLPPRKLLELLQEFERSRGRSAARTREVNAPRPLDLDIIYYGDQVVREPFLIIPHPRAHERHFVLEPLSRLRPDLILSGQTKTIAQLLEKGKDL